MCVVLCHSSIYNSSHRNLSRYHPNLLLVEIFVENVLLEVKGKAALVAMNQAGSITLQRLLTLSSPDQVGEVLAELGGESGSEFKAVSCDRCGGHVVESAVRQMSRWTGKLCGKSRVYSHFCS